MKNADPATIATAVAAIRNVATGAVRSLSKPVISTHPSVQGHWDPTLVVTGMTIREARR